MTAISVHRLVGSFVVAFWGVAIYHSQPGIQTYIVSSVAALEFGVLLFIFRGFEAFERDPNTHRIRLMRGELELAKARRHVRVQTKVI